MAITGAARLAGILGWPVKHSRSPALHGYWLEKHRIDGAYIPLPAAPENLEHAIKALRLFGFVGANVTVPHKEAVVRFVDRLHPLAKRIGAVNTLVLGADGTIEGRNTDAFGFLANLQASVTAWSPPSGPAVVLGAGGAARAVVVALIDSGVPEIRLINRTADRATRLAAELNGPIRVQPWGSWSSAFKDATLLVNTTTLGMTGQAPLAIDLDTLPQSAVVNDIVYVPLETDLLARARKRGHRVADGLGMLLHQARPAFEAWFGIDPEVTPALRAAVAADLI